MVALLVAGLALPGEASSARIPGVVRQSCAIAQPHGYHGQKVSQTFAASQRTFQGMALWLGPYPGFNYKGTVHIQVLTVVEDPQVTDLVGARLGVLADDRRSIVSKGYGWWYYKPSQPIAVPQLVRDGRARLAVQIESSGTTSQLNWFLCANSYPGGQAETDPVNSGTAADVVQLKATGYDTLDADFTFKAYFT